MTIENANFRYFRLPEDWVPERSDEESVLAGPARAVPFPPMPDTGHVYWIAQCVPCGYEWGFGWKWEAFSAVARHNRAIHPFHKELS